MIAALVPPYLNAPDKSAFSAHTKKQRNQPDSLQVAKRNLLPLLELFFFFFWIIFVQRRLQLPATSVSIRFEVSENKAMAKGMHVLLRELLCDDTCARDAARSSVLETPVVS